MMVKAHTLKWKQSELEELKSLLDKSNVVAVAELERFPASLFGEIRKKLAGKATIKVTKTRVAMKALQESKFKDLNMESHLKGSIALIFTELDPFELYLSLKQCKGKAAAKAGFIAEEDIIVPAGDTGLPPGPDLSVLKAADLPVKLQGASIKLSADKVVTKKGEAVTLDVANALAKLDIKPVELGMKVTAAIEGSQLFEASVLDIDLDQTVNNIIKAYQNTLNLSVEIAWPNKANISILLAKSFREAKAVALEAEYLCKGTAPELLGKANRQAAALGSLVDFGKTEALAEKPAEEKPAEKPGEEKTAEEPAEAKPAEAKPAEEKAGESKENA